MPLPYDDYHGIYNPSVIQLQGGMVGVARADIDPKTEIRSDRSKRLTNNYLAFELSTKLEVSNCRSLTWLGFPPQFKVIDVRLFLHNKKTYGTFQLSTTIDTSLSGHSVAEIDFDLDTIRFIGKWKIQEFHLQSTEKNWGFFQLENEIYCIYSVCPRFILARVTSLQDAKMVIIHECDLASLYQFLDPDAFVGISSAPIKFDKSSHLLTFHQHSQYCDYRHYALLLDSKSLQPKRVTPRPWFAKPGIFHWKPGMVFVTSAIATEEKILFFYGESDDTSRILCIESNDIEKKLRELDRSKLSNLEAGRKLNSALDNSKTQNHSATLELARAVLDKQPDSILANFLVASTHSQMGNSILSLRYYRKVLSETTVNAYINYHVAKELERNKEVLRSEKMYELSLSAEPNHVNSLLALGMHHFRNRTFDDALGFFQRAWTLRPRFGILCEKVVVCCLELEHWENAREVCLKGIESGGNKKTLLQLLSMLEKEPQ